MKKRILVGLAFCAAASPAFAEDGGVVGKLVTPNGTPIKGYLVVISGKTESGLVQDWISATDSTGIFMVNALPPGQYTFAPANEPLPPLFHQADDYAEHKSWSNPSRARSEILALRRQSA